MLKDLGILTPRGRKMFRGTLIYFLLIAPVLAFLTPIFIFIPWVGRVLSLLALVISLIPIGIFGTYILGFLFGNETTFFEYNSFVGAVPNDSIRAWIIYLTLYCVFALLIAYLLALVGQKLIGHHSKK